MLKDTRGWLCEPPTRSSLNRKKSTYSSTCVPVPISPPRLPFNSSHHCAGCCSWYLVYRSRPGYSSSATQVLNSRLGSRRQIGNRWTMWCRMWMIAGRRCHWYADDIVHFISYICSLLIILYVLIVLICRWLELAWAQWASNQTKFPGIVLDQVCISWDPEKDT